jgi:hypothetical protein
MRFAHRLALLTLLAPAALGAQAALPLKHAAQPTHPEITAADLMTRLYIFADDSMQGRESGKIGDVKGTDYIAAEAKRLGLVPAGDNGTYFQTIPYKQRSIDSTSTLSVNGTALTPVTEFLPTAGLSTQLTGVSIIYGGELGDSTVQLTPEQVAGKFVVFSAAGGVVGRRFRRAPAVKGAAAVAVIGLDNFPAQFLPFLRRPQGFVDDQPVGAPKPLPNFLISSAAAAKMFTTPLAELKAGAMGGTVSMDLKVIIEPMPYPSRNVVGIVPGSDSKLKGEYVAIGGHNDHIGMTARPVDHDSMRIFLSIVRPEGAEQGGKQATPQEQAQVDSLLAAYRAAHPGTARLDSISNGADDDGSGSVSVLEIAERVASLKVKPMRSILFVWHVGEEKGLLGSRFFTDHPTVSRDSIVAQLNIDMVGRGDASDETGQACTLNTATPPACDNTKPETPIHGNPNYLQVVGSRRLSTELGDLLEKVNTDGHHGIALDYSMDANGHPTNIYCRSDHYEYARYGIPIAFFTTGGHKDYHQVTDEPQYIDYEHMARVDNLIEDMLVHVANLDHRIVVDKPKPDPLGACQQ